MSQTCSWQAHKDWMVLAEMRGIPRAMQFRTMGGGIDICPGTARRWRVRLHGVAAEGETLRDAIDTWVARAGLSPFPPLSKPPA
ncbi:hypothetical protein [Cribrihabitans pelagius]|uniref:hypothetical protein n=1 Tax=Cribrihabitans pelagius TaxID=1765746 RepID=UPI003B59CA4D